MLDSLLKPNAKPSLSVLILRMLTMAFAYYVFGDMAMSVALDSTLVTPVWPPSGVALVAILLFGYPMALGVALGSLALSLSFGVPLPVALVLAIGNNLEYVGGTFLLRRIQGFHPTLDRPRDVFALMFLAGTVATTFSALPGLTAMKLGGLAAGDSFGWLFVKWWQGGMTGVLVMAPLLLVWQRPWRSRLTLHGVVEALTLLVLLLLVWYLVFDGYPVLLAVIPFSIWGALRFGMRGITLVNLIDVFLGVWGTAHGSGPFAGVSPADNVVRWCLFANVVAMTGLFLAATSEERQRALLALKDSHDELEQRVAERTIELARINAGLQQEAQERKRLEAALIEAEEEQQRKFGMELHDGLGQHLTSVAFFGATLQHKLAARALPESVAAGRIVDLINQSIETVRALSHGLYPPALQSGGLAVALRQLADTTQSMKGIPCTFQALPASVINDPLIAINFYRIAQEAVNNAVKYSKASSIRIELGLTHDRQHRLCISDDGAGFTPTPGRPGSESGPTGMGLNNMYYRASLLGGSLDIDSYPGGGTRITVRCPERSETP